MKIYNVEKKSKEDLLDLYFNVLSQNGQLVEYRWMKDLTREQLIERINKFGEDYNAIVYEYDLEHNQKIYKATFSDDKRVLKYCGKTIIIESPESFIVNAAERRAEGNALNCVEERILDELAERNK